MERLKEIKNGAPVPNTFSAAEYERRLTALRTTMADEKINAVLYTSIHNIELLLRFFILLLWPSLRFGHNRHDARFHFPPVLTAASRGDARSEKTWFIPIGNTIIIFAPLNGYCPQKAYWAWSLTTSI